MTDQTAKDQVSEAEIENTLGKKIRERRLELNIKLRAMADKIDLSPSMVSQIELGRALPSLPTLVAIVSELGLSIDELLDTNRTQPTIDQLVRRSDRREIVHLAAGVRTESLNQSDDEYVDFHISTFDVGSEASSVERPSLHLGQEYGFVLSGEIGIAIDGEETVLKTGDAISFAASKPHRLWNAGEVRAVYLALVIGRDLDPRFTKE